LIYLDYNATTPCADEVLEAMLPYFNIKYGNAGSATHSMGWIAQEAVKNARQNIAEILHCEPEEIYFTSGATEACNLAIQGIFDLYQIKGKTIICCATEHSAVLETYRHLAKYKGANLVILPVDNDGLINLETFEQSITPETILISVMFANNETGVIHDIINIGQIARKHNVLLFCDATQAVGKTDIHLDQLPIDAMAWSSHKFYGPKGVGGLFLRRKKPRVQVLPQIIGGGQERGIRSGTLNVPGIVGMSKALTYTTINYNPISLAQKRDLLEANLCTAFEHIYINGIIKNRLPHVSNISIYGIKAEKLLKMVNTELCISLGSACKSAQLKASHVLQAMYQDKKRIDGAIRISLGIETSEKDIKDASTILINAIQKIKNEIL
jgi:cysteine desulfurase